MATDSTPELIRLALYSLQRIYREGYEYKKAGALFTGLVSASQIQTDLFDQHNRMRSKQVMAALDRINDRWGAGTLRYAATGLHRAWTTQFHRRSPAYTTKWDELPLVQAH